MNKFFTFMVLGLLCGGTGMHCSREKAPPEPPPKRIRVMVDSVGYATGPQQMDALIPRINAASGEERRQILQLYKIDGQQPVPLVISPHDDYTYAGNLYPYALQHLTSPTLLIFGVAHKAAQFEVADQLVFGSYTHWMGPYGEIPVSPLRDSLTAALPAQSFIINDSLQAMEHSIEAQLPFLQYYHTDFQIIPILVPYMKWRQMQALSTTMAENLNRIMEKRNWKWGEDLAFIISNDCVHYGDEGWGGRNFAPYGATEEGYQQATNHDMNIISECLIGPLDLQRIKRLLDYTVQPDNYREYAWTWCGRYSLPFGLLTAYHLNQKAHRMMLSGEMLRYATSVSDPPIPVDDLSMGANAPANLHHWVGYTAIAFHF
ncbi:MAG: AmmeMemoRadiSam system protein B [Calditrichia bacterium]